MSLHDEVNGEMRDEDLRKALARAQKKLKAKDDLTLELVEAVYQAAKDARIAQPPLPRAPKVTVKKGETSHAAVLHTTDWQCGKRTRDFDSEILGERLNKMMDIAAVLTSRHGNPVDHGVVLLGGDMIEGISIFPTQPFEVDSGLYVQVFNVVRYVQMVVDRALSIWPTVQVVCKWGNHGRIGRFGDLPDTDNLDRMAYRMAWERYKDDPRVTWDADNSDHVQQFAVGNYRAALLHGNEFYRSASAQRLTQKLTAWQTLYNFGDTYIGHFHRRDCYGLPNGTMAYLTGSPESSNSYAADQLAAQSDPSQRLHFVDPVKGRVTAEHIIWLT